jgi:hypothetical protein
MNAGTLDTAYGFDLALAEGDADSSGDFANA